jgi:hypothetical protein
LTPLHENVSAFLKMPQDALRRNGGRQAVAVMDPFFA